LYTCSNTVLMAICRWHWTSQLPDWYCLSFVSDLAVHHIGTENNFSHLLTPSFVQNSVARIVLQQPSLAYTHGTHFSNFIGFLSNNRYGLSWLPLPTKSYTLVLHHICLNVSIPTFLRTHCDHPPLLTCTSLALIFFLVHARFILQLQRSGILSLPLPRSSQTFHILSKSILKPIFTSLFLIAPRDLSSAFDSLYWMIMAFNQILLLTYLHTYLMPSHHVFLGHTLDVLRSAS